MSQGTRAIALALIRLFNFAFAEERCNSATFQDTSLFGRNILRIDTQSHTGLSIQVAEGCNHDAKNVSDLDACEVKVAYEHPGLNITVNTVIWLPTTKQWTGRMLGNGGGGWKAGADDNTTLAWAASEGFAVVATDGGHVDDDISTWALASPGNLNWAALDIFASTSLDDAATLGKAVVKAFYGKPASYSYWNGCSQGGRQGHMLAQRYPEQYDGILATAPAIQWTQIFMQWYWPQAVMNDLGQYPHPCEFEAILAAVISFCDPHDGLTDSILLSPSTCTFDPSTLVGQHLICPSTNTSTTISAAAATVAKEAWKGSSSPSGEFLWYGLSIDANIAGLSHAGTSCSDAPNGTCVGAPGALPVGWMKYFVTLDPEFNTSNVSRAQFDRLFRQSLDRYESVIGTSNSDLSDFRAAGGKLLTWHGLADAGIGYKYTEHYVKQVYERDPQAASYYRYFEAPGLDHCGVGTKGFYPGSALKSLVKWVEEGKAPETLEARERVGTQREVDLCVWPKKMVYVGSGGKGGFGCERVGGAEDMGVVDELGRSWGHSGVEEVAL